MTAGVTSSPASIANAAAFATASSGSWWAGGPDTGTGRAGYDALASTDRFPAGHSSTSSSGLSVHNHKGTRIRTSQMKHIHDLRYLNTTVTKKEKRITASSRSDLTKRPFVVLLHGAMLDFPLGQHAMQVLFRMTTVTAMSAANCTGFNKRIQLNCVPGPLAGKDTAPPAAAAGAGRPRRDDTPDVTVTADGTAEEGQKVRRMSNTVGRSAGSTYAHREVIVCVCVCVSGKGQANESDAR